MTEAQITAFLDAQPFAKSRNQSTRMWELFSNTDPTFLREVVAAALEAASLAAPAGVSGVTGAMQAMLALEHVRRLADTIDEEARRDGFHAGDVVADRIRAALSALSLPSSEAGCAGCADAATGLCASCAARKWPEDGDRPAASLAGLGDEVLVPRTFLESVRPALDAYKRDGESRFVNEGKYHLRVGPSHYTAMKLEGDLEELLAAAPPLAAVTDEGVHSCSSYCKRPGCIERQRDEYRERLAAATVGLTDEEREALELCEREIDDPVFNLTGRVRFKRVFAALRRVLATRPPQPGSEAWDTESRRLHREITMLRDERNALLAARPPAAAGADEQGES
jgi:hypothetical protein